MYTRLKSLLFLSLASLPSSSYQSIMVCFHYFLLIFFTHRNPRIFHIRLQLHFIFYFSLVRLIDLVYGLFMAYTDKNNLFWFFRAWFKCSRDYLCCITIRRKQVLLVYMSLCNINFSQIITSFKNFHSSQSSSKLTHGKGCNWFCNKHKNFISVILSVKQFIIVIIIHATGGKASSCFNGVMVVPNIASMPKRDLQLLLDSGSFLAQVVIYICAT